MPRRPAPRRYSAIPYHSSLADLYSRLGNTGFDRTFLRNFVLPDWWEDKLADIEANRALAEAYVARQLGFSVKDLRERSRPLTLPPAPGVRFKRYRDQVDEAVRASALVALRAASVVVRAVGDRLLEASPKSARTIRDQILRHSRYVDLDSLLDFCWQSGIVVIQLAHLPTRAKRFDGMAACLDGHPVIVLASRRDGPPWLAFHLAHELGHLMLGHVGPSTRALVDTSLEAAAGTSSAEREADRFACEVLTGFEEPTIPNLTVAAPRLAAVANRSGPDRGVDPGVFALIYAKSNDRWGVAQTALKYLGLDSGGRERIAERLSASLGAAELSEDDARFLAVLKAA